MSKDKEGVRGFKTLTPTFISKLSSAVHLLLCFLKLRTVREREGRERIMRLTVPLKVKEKSVILQAQELEWFAS